MRQFILLVAASLVAGEVGAQGPDPGALERHLFPPELVMQHQKALQLTDEQRQYIIDQIQQTQSQFTPLQWGLQRHVEHLTEVLQSPGVDEEAVLAQLDRVLEQERQIKRLHFLLGVRIRNALTEEQREKLKGWRASSPQPAGPGPRRPDGGRF